MTAEVANKDAAVTRSHAPIGNIQARASTIPTDTPETDGTFGWDATTMVLVEVAGGDRTGLGYTCADSSVAPFIGALARGGEL